MLSYFPLVLCVGVFGCLRLNILSHWGSFGVLRDDICFISYHHGGHSVAHPKQPRTSYSSSQLRSFRKSSSKQRLKADLWKTLGELGIRKPFRSKRKKVQSSSVDGSLPVVSDTGTPQSSLIADIPHSKHGKVTSIPNILVSNVRSLEPKIDELSCILKLNAVNVACITETWLKPEIPDSMVSIHDFNLYRKDRSTRGGGIAAYISSSIQCKRLIIDKELCESITETMWIHLKPHRLPRSVSTILLGVVYHPPQATADDNNTLYNHV